MPYIVLPCQCFLSALSHGLFHLIIVKTLKQQALPVTSPSSSVENSGLDRSVSFLIYSVSGGCSLCTFLAVSWPEVCGFLLLLSLSIKNTESLGIFGLDDR